MYGWDRFARYSFVIYSIAEYHLAPKNVRPFVARPTQKYQQLRWKILADHQFSDYIIGRSSFFTFQWRLSRMCHSGYFQPVRIHNLGIHNLGRLVRNSPLSRSTRYSLRAEGGTLSPCRRGQHRRRKASRGGHAHHGGGCSPDVNVWALPCGQTMPSSFPIRFIRAENNGGKF